MGFMDDNGDEEGVLAMRMGDAKKKEGQRVQIGGNRWPKSHDEGLDRVAGAGAPHT